MRTIKTAFGQIYSEIKKKLSQEVEIFRAWGIPPEGLRTTLPYDSVELRNQTCAGPEEPTEMDRPIDRENLEWSAEALPPRIRDKYKEIAENEALRRNLYSTATGRKQSNVKSFRLYFGGHNSQDGHAGRKVAPGISIGIQEDEHEPRNRFNSDSIDIEFFDEHKERRICISTLWDRAPVFQIQQQNIPNSRIYTREGCFSCWYKVLHSNGQYVTVRTWNRFGRSDTP